MGQFVVVAVEPDADFYVFEKSANLQPSYNRESFDGAVARITGKRFDKGFEPGSLNYMIVKAATADDAYDTAIIKGLDYKAPADVLAARAKLPATIDVVSNTIDIKDVRMDLSDEAVAAELLRTEALAQGSAGAPRFNADFAKIFGAKPGMK
ncbi:MAG: hypothetical protein KGQ41_08910 [Alphaproteobacteria bacterium]|nr:hypothetical protein [Alphaproteobacteria bacterium]